MSQPQGRDGEGSAATDCYPMGTLPLDKTAARAEARAVRDALTDPTLRADAARAVRDRVAALGIPEIVQGGCVGGYWPLGSELDVRPAMLHLREKACALALPVSGPRGTALTFRDWDPDAPMATGRYGIQEPGADRPVVQPRALLVPLLAFDRRGGRLGYGAGYYDRTLAALRAGGPVLAVGVAFAAQERDAVPCDAHDEPMDWIVTERETLRFGG